MRLIESIWAMDGVCFVSVLLGGVFIGGRSWTEAAWLAAWVTAGTGYVQARFPWLDPGFSARSERASARQ